MSVATDGDTTWSATESEAPLTVDQIQRCLGIDRDALRDLVGDLNRPRELIYWTDFLLSATVGYCAFYFLQVRQPGSFQAIALYCVAVLALYRAVIFIHEISHRPSHKFRVFRVVWNLLCGVPMLLPSYFYDEHRGHHAGRTYGTQLDGEYLSYPRLPIGYTLLLFGISPLVLPALVFRFLVLTPLMLVFPKLRDVILTHASSLVIDSTYRRSIPVGGMPKRWLVQELSCFAWCVAIVTALASGLIPVARAVEAELVFGGIFAVNALRTLLAHKYAGEQRRMEFHEQVLDSRDFPVVLGVLWAPVGLRFHAVHHLLPNLPYHALATAHRRIMAALPNDSPFLACQQPSLIAGVRAALELRRRFP